MYLATALSLILGAGRQVDERFAVNATIDGRPAHLFVDTGSQRTMVSADWALTKTPSGKHVVGTGGKVQNLHLGRLTKSLPEELEDSSRVDGVLGMDFLSKYTVGIDAKNALLTLWPQGVTADTAMKSWSATKGHDPRKFKYLNFTEDRYGCPLVGIEVQGAELKALVDSGSNGCGIDVESIEDVGPILLCLPVPSNLLDQASRELPTFAPTSLEIGGFGLKPPQWALIIPGSRGGEDFIFGADALSQFRLVFDFNKKTLAIDGDGLSVRVGHSNAGIEAGRTKIFDTPVGLLIGSQIFFKSGKDPLLIAHPNAMFDYEPIDKNSGIFTLKLKE